MAIKTLITGGSDGEIANITDQALDVNVVATVGGSGGGTDPVGLKNIAAATIDPATEQKQDAIIAGQLADGHNVVVTSAPTTAVTNAGLTELAAAINLNEMDVNIASDAVGLATSAGQLLDGHNVVVTSAPTTAVTNAGLTELAAAINVSSQMDINIAADAVGLATSAGQLADGHDVKAQLQDDAGIGLTSTLVGADQSLDINVVQTTGLTDTELRATAVPVSGTVATTNAIVDGWDNTASDGASVSGDVAHDAVDAGEPVKIGIRAHDYDPDATGEHADKPSEVAKLDRANLVGNLRGELIEGVNSKYESLGSFDNIYNVNAETATSSNIECWNYRWATVQFDLVSSGTPTTFLVEIEISNDGGTNWAKLMNGPLGSWIYEDTICATEIVRALTFPIACWGIRVKGTVALSSGSFTTDNGFIYLRN